MTSTDTALTRERADLIESLDRHRFFLRYTVQGLTDEQATRRTTASELTLAGLVKHVTGTEAAWVRFIEGGAEAMSGDWNPEAWARQWRLEAGETLAGLLADHDGAARGGPCRACSPTRPGGPATPTNWSPRCPTWTPTTRCPRRRGSSRVPAGRPVARCCTSLPRRPSTPGTPTSSGSPWTGRRRWAEDPGGQGATAIRWWGRRLSSVSASSTRRWFSALGQRSQRPRAPPSAM